MIYFLPEPFSTTHLGGCIEVTLSSFEYKVCEQYAQKRWSNGKRGFYGRGILNSDQDPFRVERIGLLGEVAFAKVFNWPVDLSYRKGGDQSDFQIGKAAIDVKTSAVDRGSALVLHTNSNGKEVISYKDIYVISFITEDDIETKIGSVNFVGYVTGDYLKDRPIVPSPLKSASHLNKEILYQDCVSILHLLSQKNLKFPNRNLGSSPQFFSTLLEAQEFLQLSDLPLRQEGTL